MIFPKILWTDPWTQNPIVPIQNFPKSGQLSFPLSASELISANSLLKVSQYRDPSFLNVSCEWSLDVFQIATPYQFNVDKALLAVRVLFCWPFQNDKIKIHHLLFLTGQLYPYVTDSLVSQFSLELALSMQQEWVDLYCLCAWGFFTVCLSGGPWF